MSGQVVLPERREILELRNDRFPPVLEFQMGNEHHRQFNSFVRFEVSKVFGCRGSPRGECETRIRPPVRDQSHSFAVLASNYHSESARGDVRRLWRAITAFYLHEPFGSRMGNLSASRRYG